MADALEDFRGLVASGEQIEKAASIVATDHGFRADVVLVRASKMFGPLDGLSAKIDVEREKSKREVELNKAISEFADLEENISAQEWLASRLGRDPDESEVSRAVDLTIERWIGRNLHRFRK
jgi:hypothetical protein